MLRIPDPRNIWGRKSEFKTYLANIFFVITLQTPVLRKENSGMLASYMFSVLPSGSGKILHFHFTWWVHNSSWHFSGLLTSNNRTYATSQNSFLPFSFTYNFIDFSTSLVSELRPSVPVHGFVMNFVWMFYCDCILRMYDVETTTEATGMRPDILWESILSSGRKGILQHVSIYTTYW